MHSRRFALEQAYRKTYDPKLIDLSSSSSTSPALGDLLGATAMAELASQSLAYEPSGGGRELRAAVASLYRGIDADDVLITAGAVEAIRAVAMAAVCPGDRVIVHQPAYDAMRQAVFDCGGSVVPWQVDTSQSLAESAKKHDCRTAFINSPHGPTGSIASTLGGFQGRLVVDEVYRPIALHAGRVPSCLESLPGAVSIGDLSKPLGLGGLRIGWIVSKDREVIERCAGALDYLSGSVSVLSARVGLEALSRFDDLLAPCIDSARANLMLLAAFVERHRNFLEWTPPQAGYTAALRLCSGPPPARLFENLRERGFFLLDGAVLGMPEHLRIGLGLARDAFETGLEALGEELSRLGLASATAANSTADVIIYTKMPRPGEGKSRLAAGLGAEKAANLARAFLEDTLACATAESRRLFVALATLEGSDELRSQRPCASVYQQSGADMGQRLNAAFEDAFARGAVNPVLIGSDSPTLPPHLLSVAARALESHDVVVGPATDGGYYLIGLRRPQPALFQNIEWSTHRTLSQTIERARCAGLSVFFLPPWYDIDTPADLAQLRIDVREGSATARTLGALA